MNEVNSQYKKDNKGLQITIAVFQQILTCVSFQSQVIYKCHAVPFTHAPDQIRFWRDGRISLPQLIIDNRSKPAALYIDVSYR